MIFLKHIVSLVVFRYDLEAEISTLQNKLSYYLKMNEGASVEQEQAATETQQLTIKIREVERRIEVYKTEIIQKEAIIERFKLLNTSSEQEIGKLKREVEIKSTECNGYIEEIQKLNQEKADFDIELNHTKTYVNKLEIQLKDVRKEYDAKIKTVRTELEIQINSLSRELESKNIECEGYIKEIQILNQVNRSKFRDINSFLLTF